MLNHTYASVKNANLVDCGKKQHIASQPSPLLKDNFLGEFRTELDKKKVLANLGIAAKLSLVWENITGDIGANELLIKALDSRTTYISLIEQFKGDTISIIDGIRYLETIVGGEQEGEDEQNKRLKLLEEQFKLLADNLDLIIQLLKDPIKIDIDTLKQNLEDISKQIADINSLIQIAGKDDNALVLIPENSELLAEGETPGLYVPNLEPRVKAAESRFDPIELDVRNLQTEVTNVKKDYVSKVDLGGDGDFKFIKEQDFTSYKSSTATTLRNIQTELVNTIKKGEDGHVKDLSVHLLSKYTDDDNIKITDSFEVTSGIPLDVRFVVKSLNDLHNLNPQVCYPGMGVIVNETCALYILREPLNEGVITNDYVADPKNWKCPEDLVTKALSREEYENLNTIDLNIFYYIYEGPITQTQEPIRKQGESEEAWKIRWNEWVESLKTLLQEYMSAVWGTDIENQVLKKANQSDLDALRNDLQDLIDILSGGDNSISLSSLVDRIAETESDLQQLLGTTDPETGEVSTGKIGEIETEIGAIKKDYVSIESITEQNNQSGQSDYIFVTKSDYATDQDSHNEAISKQIETELVTTKQIETELVTTDQLKLSNLPITANDNDLLIDSKKVALLEEVPIIIEISLTAYDSLVTLNKIDPKAYYYIIEEEIYITKTTRTSNIENINLLINAILETITDLSNRVTLLENSKK